MTEKPELERASPTEAARRARTRIADATIAARRLVERLGVARLILVTAAQVVIVVVLWRLSVGRSRRRRLHAEAWLRRG